MNIRSLQRIGRVGFAVVVLCVGGMGVGPVWARGEVEVEVVEVEPVWAGHRVGFSLLTHGEDQFVAYYDADRRMTVAQRKVGSNEWVFEKLPEKVGWDSHNSITMVVDREGHLHVTGNMHVDPLVYFRTTEPLDVRSLERVGHMVGSERERRVTYPRFIDGPGGELIFRYRDGSSGSGDDIYNVYDEETRRWERLLDEPLLSGEGEMNAYAIMPTLGPDGWFHLVWVWRDTPDAATNHDLSYARSRDLIHWETGGGEPLELPITLETGDVVDPVPAGGGIINGNTKLGFDSRDRPVITYHKYDEEGDTQVYNARLEGGAWEVYQTSDWEGYRWDFGGGGSIGFEVGIGSVQPAGEGRLTLSYRYGRGSGKWVLDEETLKPVDEPAGAAEGASEGPAVPRSVRRVESDFPGMGKRMAHDLGGDGEAGVRYVLTWETLGPNRDRPREGPLPGSSMLRVVKVSSEMD